MVVFRSVFILCALFYLLFKLLVAYDYGHSMQSGGVPLLDGVIIPLLVLTFGVYIISAQTGITLQTIGIIYLLATGITAVFLYTFYRFGRSNPRHIQPVSNLEQDTKLEQDHPEPDKSDTSSPGAPDQEKQPPLDSKKESQYEKGPFSYQQAKERVQKNLDQILADRKYEPVILDEATITKPYGWLFLWDSSKHLETNNPADAVFGNNPIFVNRVNGEVEGLSIDDLEFIDGNVSYDPFFHRYERKRNITRRST